MQRDENRTKAKFDVYETLALMRERPGVYLGEASLVLLQAFLNGCFHLSDEYGIVRCECPDFHGFHEWVARKFQRFPTAMGWCSIIMEECGGDGDKAWVRFFELLDGYRHKAK